MFTPCGACDVDTLKDYCTIEESFQFQTSDAHQTFPLYSNSLTLYIFIFVTLAGKSHRHHVSPKEGAVVGDDPKQASSPEAAVVPPIEERRRPGYCECCSVRYRDLSMVSGPVID